MFGLQLKGNALGIFAIDSQIRLGCHGVLNYQHYESLMTVCIVVSCVQMAIEVQVCNRLTHLVS